MCQRRPQQQPVYVYRYFNIARRCNVASSLVCCFFITAIVPFPTVVHSAFVGRHVVHRRQRHTTSTTPVCDSSDIVDVDFVPVDNSSRENNSNNNNKIIPDNDDNDEDVPAQHAQRSILLDEKIKTLLDISFDSDPDLANLRVPFIDTCSPSNDGVNYIDVKLAFMAELDQVQYGIAVPYDAAVAITCETEDGAVQYLSPESDDNEELMSIMAVQVQEHIGDDLRLQRTPRVLTISGPLDKYTNDWQSKILPAPIEPKVLVDAVDMSDNNNNDDDVDFFMNFMRKELGEEEFQKTMNETPDEDDSELERLYQLFDVPGLGVKSNDSDGVEELMKSLLTPESDFEAAKESLGLNNLEHEGVALKLVSYVFAGGKSYSLVKLLQPYVIVGKYVVGTTAADGDKSSVENAPKFELLTPDEEKIVLPRLEQVCRNDLESAGLTFQFAR